MTRILFAVSLLLGLSAASQAADGIAPTRLDLFVGDTRVVDVAARRVAVGNGDVATVSTLDAGQLLFLAGSPGTTTVHVWLRDGGRREFVVNVTPANLTLALENVRRMLEGTSNVTARIAGDRIVLEGDRVADADQRRAAAIAEAFGGTVLNFVGRVGWEPMLEFDVRIVEVRRSALRDLGIRWDATANGPAVGVIADLSGNDFFRIDPPPAAVPGLTSLPLPQRVWRPATYAGITTVLGSRIALLEQKGDATLVAQPMLSCRSGGSARFVSGGEFPIPVIDGNGSTDVEFKEYGVILDVKPVTDRSGVIYAQVETEVSQIDEAVRVLGVPGLLKRKTVTELNLKEGEVAVLAGLASRTRGAETQRVPGLGSMPIVGGLFRGTQRREADSELLVLITPRVLQPSSEPGPRPDVNAAALQRSNELAARASLGGTESPPLRVLE